MSAIESVLLNLVNRGTSLTSRFQDSALASRHWIAEEFFEEALGFVAFPEPVDTSRHALPGSKGVRAIVAESAFLVGEEFG